MSSARMILILTFLVTLVYTGLVTVVSQLIFPYESQGSLVIREGKMIGSSVMGQKFVSDKYFHGRPSAVDYNPLPSGGSNWGPTSTEIKKAIQNGSNQPKDLIFSSGSGLDPDISSNAAQFQIDRIVKARGWDEYRRRRVLELVEHVKKAPQFGFLGDERVNVLALNLALDEIK